MKALFPIGAVALALALPAAAASGINGVNSSMPNRLSMNVTVPKQTQGATFGEKVNAGLHAAGGALAQGAALKIDIGCGSQACLIAFPDGEGFRADLQALQLAPLDAAGRTALQHWGDPHVDGKERAITQGASLLGAALPGGSIVSAAVSSVSALGTQGGAAAASYAATGRVANKGKVNGQVTVNSGASALKQMPQEDAAVSLPSRRVSAEVIDITRPLADGDYQLEVVVERATSGLKDTLKTQVRAAAPQVKITLVFSVQDGTIKTKHDTVKNSVSNIR